MWPLRLFWKGPWNLFAHFGDIRLSQKCLRSIHNILRNKLYHKDLKTLSKRLYAYPGLIAFPLSGDWREVKQLLFGSYTAVTNYHKFGDLKQHRFILSQFWRPEIWNNWAKIKVSAGPCSFQRLWGKIYSLPSEASGDCSPSLACGCITPVYKTGTFKSSSAMSIYGTLYIQNNVSISRSLIKSNLRRPFLPYKIAFIGSRNQDLLWEISFNLQHGVRRDDSVCEILPLYSRPTWRHSNRFEEGIWAPLHWKNILLRSITSTSISISH